MQARLRRRGHRRAARRRRRGNQSAHSPSWQGDSRHILYQSLDKLRIVDIERGKPAPCRSTPWTPAVPTGRTVVHAGKTDRHEEPTPRTNVDVVIDGNRITSVVAHADANHAGGNVVDACGLTVMPGLMEFHSHLQPDFGESQGRAWLAFGVTDGAQPGQHAVRSGRGARGQRSRRASRSARLRHRLSDGMAARLLQDGDRDLERRPVRDGAAAREGARSTI